MWDEAEDEGGMRDTKNLRGEMRDEIVLPGSGCVPFSSGCGML